MGTKGTEGTQKIEHDWDNIKLPTDRYKVSRMEIKIFRYKIIEEVEVRPKSSRTLT